MIVGLGIDLLENCCVERELARGEWLLGDGIFTGEEIRECNSSKKAALRYASCFAVKEATLKAMNDGIGDLRAFREVEVRVGSNGEYRVVLHGNAKLRSERLGTRQIRLSVARNSRYTAAMVILED